MKIINPNGRYLFINISDISIKLFEDSQFLKKNKVLFYNTETDKRSIIYLIDKLKIKNIIIETSSINHISEKLTNDLVNSRYRNVKVYDVQDFYEKVNKRIPLLKFDSNEYFADNIFSIGMFNNDRIFKRFFDILLSILLLPIAIPLILAGCILIFIDSPGNVFFTQTRSGKNSCRFKIYKLRTMKSIHSGDFTKENDDRLLKVGKFLRKTKIDELPQIFNVLKGDMSLIGPRPERPEFVEDSIKENAYFDLRHLVKPGLTGWAQVHLPKATPVDNLKKLEYDLYYIKYYNFKLDLFILLKTVKVVFTMNSH
ncbi:sugar transferase [Chryseobacterium aquaticum]|uniref:Sugar transferase n=1 Tax=Chryseobacterium aquaticum subsp. greenlandense TaxID=345663 RepID=A0A101CLD8_9FLAO|nr:sugar transferase [Chryseobacterium aquaticum]KUJ58352.1 sugar transferase [Chryseobacterium aquaticum subsp. greenlandense]